MTLVQAVYKSELYLTDLQIISGMARYLWSDFIYDDPNEDMTVAVTGFLNPTNNIVDTQIINVDLDEQWFEVTHTTQVDETATALARASTPFGATCANISKPLWSSNIMKGQTRSGCTWLNGRARKRRAQRAGYPFWNDYYNTTIGKERKQLLKQISMKWKNVLSDAQRSAWNALAAGISWVNYKGVQKTGNGFQLFIAVNTIWRYTYGTPWFTFPAPSWPIYLDPPATWNPPAAPAMSSPTLEFDAWYSINVSNAPESSDWWSAAPLIQKGRYLSTKKHRSFHPVRDFLGDFYSDPPLLWATVDFPISKLDVPIPCSLQYRWLNINTGVFSDPTFIQLP